MDSTGEGAALGRLRDREWALAQTDTLRALLEESPGLDGLGPVIAFVRDVMGADAAWLARDADPDGPLVTMVELERRPAVFDAPRRLDMPMDPQVAGIIRRSLAARAPVQTDFHRREDRGPLAASLAVGSWLIQALPIVADTPWLVGLTVAHTPRVWRPIEHEVFRRICRIFEAELARRLAVARLRAELGARSIAEAAVQESEGRLRTLIDASPDIICFKDGQGRWLEANAADLRLFCLEGIDYRGRTDAELADVTNPCFREAFLNCQDSDEAAWRAGGVSRGEERVATPDGGLVVLDVIKVPILRADGGREGLIVLGRDVTARRRAEADQRLASVVVERSGEAILVADARGDLVSVNPAFSRIFGYPAEAVVGRNYRFLRAPRHDASFYDGVGDTLRRVGQWAGELWFCRRDGEGFPSWATLSAVRGDDDRATHFVACIADISALRRSEARVAYLAQHDSLTGLPNRISFEGRLTGAVERAQRQGGCVGVLIAGLDGFRRVNDSHGQLAGDALLAQVADRLRSLFEQHEVARLGADEFAVLIASAGPMPDIDRQAERLLSAFGEPFQISGLTLFSSCSAGVARMPDESAGADALLRDATAALHAAKAAGPGSYRLYNQALTRAAAQRLELESELRGALRRDQLHLAYQPVVALPSGRLMGFEALARWQHAELGAISPARFIPVAEASGLIGALGCWALRTACRQAAAWLAAGVDLEFVAVNVSGRQLDAAADFVAEVERALDESALPPHHLELEITESALLGQPEKALAALYAIRAKGVRISIDDFGTGYSSLTQVRQLPAHKLKLDQSFVRDLPDDPNDCAIARTVLALGRGLGLTVVAEGVETAAQRAFLEAEGCELVQGYLFSRPQVPSALGAWLVTKR